MSIHQTWKNTNVYTFFFVRYLVIYISISLGIKKSVWQNYMVGLSDLVSPVHPTWLVLSIQLGQSRPSDLVSPVHQTWSVPSIRLSHSYSLSGKESIWVNDNANALSMSIEFVLSTTKVRVCLCLLAEPETRPNTHSWYRSSESFYRLTRTKTEPLQVVLKKLCCYPADQIELET